MRRINTLLLSLAILVLTACGGGGGGSTSNPPAPPVVVDQQATGLWKGTFTQTGVGTFDVIGLVYGDQVRFYSETAETLYIGTVSVSGDQLTAYTYVYANGGYWSAATLNGTVYTKSFIEGTFSDDKGATGSLYLSYDSLTDHGAALSMVDGNWSMTDGTYTLALAVDANGQVHGSDGYCVFNGNVGVLDPAVNIYSVSLDESCSGYPDENYSGYGVLYDDNTLIVVVEGQVYYLVGSFFRN